MLLPLVLHTAHAVRLLVVYGGSTGPVQTLTVGIGVALASANLCVARRRCRRCGGRMSVPSDAKCVFVCFVFVRRADGRYVSERGMKRRVLIAWRLERERAARGSQRARREVRV